MPDSPHSRVQRRTRSASRRLVVQAVEDGEIENDSDVMNLEPAASAVLQVRSYSARERQMENFEQKGVVSVWVFREDEDPADAEKDVLQDFCGVDYYDLDDQEGDLGRDGPQPLASLLSQLSFSGSFIHDAMAAADRMGINEAYGVIVQFDFAYDPSKVTRPISRDPVFIGYFDWHD